MTVVMHLNAESNLESAFTLLPITKIPLDENRKKTKKFKIPNVGEPGDIFSARYRG